jgi:hypothetical protein
MTGEEWAKTAPPPNRDLARKLAVIFTPKQRPATEAKKPA